MKHVHSKDPRKKALVAVFKEYANAFRITNLKEGREFFQADCHVGRGEVVRAVRLHKAEVARRHPKAMQAAQIPEAPGLARGGVSRRYEQGALYSRAVDWIAKNDETHLVEKDDIAETPVVQAIAHVFSAPAGLVASDVLAVRGEQ